jgi:hypothetical protein
MRGKANQKAGIRDQKTKGGSPKSPVQKRSVRVGGMGEPPEWSSLRPAMLNEAS